MTQPLLEKIVADFETDAPNWTTFDFEHFSRDKTLWDYQQNALQGAMKALWSYYDNDRDDIWNFQPNEDSDKANNFRKGKFWGCYETFMIGQTQKGMKIWCNARSCVIKKG